MGSSAGLSVWRSSVVSWDDVELDCAESGVWVVDLGLKWVYLVSLWSVLEF